MYKLNNSFTIPNNEVKDKEFKEFLILDLEYANTSALITFHQAEAEKHSGKDKEYNLNKIMEYTEAILDITEKRAIALATLLDGAYDVETLNTRTLRYWFSYLGREVKVYEFCAG